jgi:hypothetical protein
MGVLTVKNAISQPTGTMTAEQRLRFQGLLSAEYPATTAEVFDSEAEKFDNWGLRQEANLLRKRARIARLPANSIAKIKQAFITGLSNKDPVAVRVLANTFESEGFFGNAEALRDYANDLDVGNAIAQTQAAIMSRAARQSAVANATPAAVSAAQKATSPQPGTIGAMPPAVPAGAGVSQVIASATPAELAAAKAALAAELAGKAIPSTTAAAPGQPQAPQNQPAAGAGPTAGPPTSADFAKWAQQEAVNPGSTAGGPTKQVPMPAANPGAASVNAAPTGSAASAPGVPTVLSPADIANAIASATPEQLAKAKAAVAAEMKKSPGDIASDAVGAAKNVIGSIFQ